MGKVVLIDVERHTWHSNNNYGRIYFVNLKLMLTTILNPHYVYLSVTGNLKK